VTLAFAVALITKSLVSWTWSWLDPKPAPLAVFAAEFSSAENLPKKVRLAEYANAIGLRRQVFFA